MSIMCDFCKKDNTEVEVLVASDKHDHICNECVDICNKIIVEHRATMKVNDNTKEEG